MNGNILLFAILATGAAGASQLRVSPAVPAVQLTSVDLAKAVVPDRQTAMFKAQIAALEKQQADQATLIDQLSKHHWELSYCVSELTTEVKVLKKDLKWLREKVISGEANASGTYYAEASVTVQPPKPLGAPDCHLN